jgi:hypothetical protein
MVEINNAIDNFIRDRAKLDKWIIKEYGETIKKHIEQGKLNVMDYDASDLKDPRINAKANLFDMFTNHVKTPQDGYVHRQNQLFLVIINQ